MNAPTPLPSPLVPQGSIPPKNTSRSGRVLLIALTVVVFHIAGLGVVLMQGCQKDAKTAGGAGETNAYSLAPMDSTNSMFTAATPTPTNPPPAPASNIVAYTPPTPTPTPTPAPNFSEPPTSTPVEPATMTMTEYKIARGDTLGNIAKKNKISLGALTAANPGLDPAKLQVGKAIKIPAQPAAAAPVPKPALGNGDPHAVVAAGYYQVKAGDTLTKIAKANGVTVGELRAANSMKTSQIHPGQNLKVPGRATATAPGPTRH